VYSQEIVAQDSEVVQVRLQATIFEAITTPVELSATETTIVLLISKAGLSDESKAL
jgi:hypothetical protein